MKVAYVAGPYRDKRGLWFIRQNIRAAERVALELWRMGYAVICPHKNTAFFDGAAPDDVWIKGDLVILERCDLVVMLPGSEKSEGAMAEFRHAVAKGVDVFRWPEGKDILQELVRQ